MNTDDDSTPPVRPRRRSRWGHALHMSISFVLGISVMAALLVYVLVGQTIRAPSWVRDRIETRVEQDLGEDLQLNFSELEFVLRKGWRPRVRLLDMALIAPDGQTLVQLANAEASLAMRPLLKGRIQPKRIYLSGAIATLQRNVDGKIELYFGEGNAPVRSAANLPQLIATWSEQLAMPPLSALTAFEIEGLTLRYEDLSQGRGWTLDGGRIQLDRDGDELRLASSFALLGGGDSASLAEANYTTRIGAPDAEFGISVRDVPAQDVAAQNVALNWLGVLRAPISGALRGSVDAEGALGRLSATLQIGAGALQPADAAHPVPFEGARSYFTYTPSERMLSFDELSVATAWGSGSAEGRAYLGGEGGALSDLVGQFSLTGLSIDPEGMYDQPLELDRATADFRLELRPFRLTLGEAVVQDGDSALHLSGGFDAGQSGWRLALDGRIDQMTPDRVVALWPARVAPKPRDWAARNFTGGLLRDINFALRGEPGARPNIYADFDFQDAEIRFLKTMPPITGAAGQATFIDNRFTVTATAGQVLADQGSALDVTGTSFIVPDTGIKQGAPGIVRIQGAGPVNAVMSLLNRPPLQVLKGTPFTPDLAQGQVQVGGTLALPLKDKVPFSEIEFHVDGAIADVASDVLVPGHTVTAPRLRITGDQSRITLAGAGLLDDVPADVSWTQPLGQGVGKASRLSGAITLSPELVDTLNIGLPPGSVAGEGRGDFSLDFAPGEPPALRLRSDLEGLRLSLPELGWSKAAQTEGRLELEGRLGTAARIDRLELQAAGLAATGTVQTRANGGLDRASFSSVRIGNWLNAQVDLVGRGDAPPETQIRGGSLDMRSAAFGGSRGASGPLSVALDRLQISDTIALTNVTGDFTTSGGLNGAFSGLVNGQTAVSGELVPQGGRNAVRLRSDDAGGVFRSAGILRQGRGGDFNLVLTPVDTAGQFNGTLRVTDTRVRDAPAIAALLNSVSVIGLLDEMTGQGIQFSEVDARFRLSPSQLTLYSSSAVGPSIGLSMDGIFDMVSGRLDMQGVISPVYVLNGIGAVLTRKGEGLLGFNYTLRGTAQDPAVSVNPLSALTPSVFREIFRAPPPQDPDAPARETVDRSTPYQGADSTGGR